MASSKRKKHGAGYVVLIAVLIRGMAMVTDITSILSTSGYNKNPEPSVLGFVAERWGFEPQNAFDTLHDFQSCALDQLSHLSIFGSAFWAVALSAPL